MRDGQQIQMVAFGRGPPAQGLAGTDNGIGQVSSPAGEILRLGSLTEEAGVLVILHCVEKSLPPSGGDHRPRLFFLVSTPSTQRRSSLPGG
ncbi:MAG: hypothetical protein BWY13_00043 [Euryarchaeota archaeon ADurb.Bin190]|nr:MAG: hypothetical protein BWY13_00043 [Euryarchaeota archaeon ADurb.Bin190]